MHKYFKVILRKDIVFYTSAGVSLLVIINLLVFAVNILLSSLTIQTMYIPDDGYYYLVLARNFNTYLKWTFDSGISVTSGFHPLLAYIYSLLYYIVKPSVSNFPKYGIVFEVSITFVVCIFVWFWAVRRRKLYWLLTLSILVSSKNFIFNSMSLMEWPLIVLFATLFFYIYYESNEQKKIKSLLLIFLYGMLGSFSRSDFFFFPFIIFLVDLFNYLTSHKNKITLSLIGLGGAVIGVLIMFIHNYLFTGEFFQSSARMKLFWGFFPTDEPTIILHIIELFGEEIFSGFFLVLLSSFFFIFTLNILGYKTNFRIIKDRVNFSLFMVSIVTVLVYMVIYSFSNALYRWYSANFIVPCFIFMVGSIWYFFKLFKFHRIVILIGAILIYSIVIHNISNMYPISSDIVPWKEQALVLEALDYLKKNNIHGQISAFNSGILGYYLNSKVINLDGLVNNDIYNYAIRNNTFEYIQEKKIKYIIDYDPMFGNQNFRKSRGVDSKDFLNKLELVKKFKTNFINSKEFSTLSIYKVNK